MVAREAGGGAGVRGEDDAVLARSPPAPTGELRSAPPIGQTPDGSWKLPLLWLRYPRRELEAPALRT
jgi:hypothetical protein